MSARDRSEISQSRAGIHALGRVLARRGTLRSDTGGAVYVEFLIAFLPFLVLFLCLWQVSILFSVKLMVDHAAITAARAGAVVVAESPKRIGASSSDKVNELSPYRKAAVKNAVEIALAPLIINGTIASISLDFPNPDDHGGKDAMSGKSYPVMSNNTVAMFRVRVTAQMMCRIAFANVILCKGLGQLAPGILATQPKTPVVGEAIFPYQGASYTYDSND